MSHSATLQLVGEALERHIVVRAADDVIWIASELMAHARDPHRERALGDMEIGGDLISFGTSGEGLGRLTYRITGRHRDQFGTEWTVAERVKP